MMRNSLICKLINVQANIKENNEKKIKIDDEISKLIKAFLKDLLNCQDLYYNYRNINEEVI